MQFGKQIYPQEKIESALNIIESPWSRRDEKELKNWFNQDFLDFKKSEFLIERVNRSGLEGFIPPKRLDPIENSDIKLIVWMGISSDV